VEAGDRELVALREVDLDRLDAVALELPDDRRRAGITTLPGARVTPFSARSQYSSTGTSMIV
jgi:hypothetical protein